MDHGVEGAEKPNIASLSILLLFKNTAFEETHENYIGVSMHLVTNNIN